LQVRPRRCRLVSFGACARQHVERRGPFVQLIERARAKHRRGDRLQRRGVRQEDAGAHDGHRQPRFAASFEEKTREIDRVDDVRRLKLVETAPDQAREPRAQIEVCGPELPEQVPGPRDGRGRCPASASGFAVGKESVHVAGEIEANVFASVLPPLDEHTSPQLCDTLASPCLRDIRYDVHEHRYMTIYLRMRVGRCKKAGDTQAQRRKQNDRIPLSADGGAFQSTTPPISGART
jgi:hypothetical protein